MISCLNNNAIEVLLKEQLVGRIGCHADGITYIVPISYAYEEPFVYAHTHEGLKLQILRKNPSVCFEVDDTKDMGNWKSVIAWGDFEELNSHQARSAALQILNKRKLPLQTSVTTHLGTAWPFSTEDPDDVGGVFFRIHLKEKTGRFENNTETPLFPY